MALIDALRRSPLSQASDAAAAISGGWTCDTSAAFVITPDLARTYTLRGDHLASRPGSHAAQLCTSVREFSANLQKHLGQLGAFTTIRGTEEHRYLVFSLADGGAALGCLKTIGQLEVTAERWMEIWSLSSSEVIDYHALGLESPHKAK